MGSLTPIEELSRQIMDRLPSAHVSVDAPSESSGNWYVDVKLDSRSVVVEWRPSAGFGVSLQPGGYGEGPEIILPSAPAAAAFVAARLVGRREEVNVLLASVDAVWRGAIHEQLKHQHVQTEVVAAYADAIRRLAERRYNVVVIDLPTDAYSAGYADLQKRLVGLTALVVLVGWARSNEPSEEWFEVFVRKALAPSRIASIVESLATTITAQIP